MSVHVEVDSERIAELLNDPDSENDAGVAVDDAIELWLMLENSGEMIEHNRNDA